MEATGGEMTEALPKEDKYGNILCPRCNKYYASDFKKCVRCCLHNTLEFDEEYDIGWRLCVKCRECGKNYGFDNDYLIKNFKIVMDV